MLSVCGMNCARCENRGKSCKGCAQADGEVFFARLLGEKSCPIYLCAKRKGFSNCAQCDDMPCAHYYRLRDPALTEDEWLGGICVRMQKLREAN